jgi:NADPH2:quinone reductase
MKAIQVHELGGPEALQYDEVAMPEPALGEARVKVGAAGVNFIDVYHRKGMYPGQLPMTPGLEAAGVVDAVGPDVSDVKVGDLVAYSGQIGSYAEYNAVPTWKLVPVPESSNEQQAAALMLQGMTAHYLAVDTYPLGADDTALVHAAAGGVGHLLVQVAKLRGARVIGTVSTEEKAGLARSAGADEVIIYTEEDFQEATMELTDGKGVDVVYESVGLTTFDQSLNCLRPRGYLVLYGQASGAVPPVDPQILNNKGSLFLTRPSIVHYTSSREAILERTSDLFRWIADDGLEVRIDRTFPLADAADAHRYIEGRKTKGKLLLIP